MKLLLFHHNFYNMDLYKAEIFFNPSLYHVYMHFLFFLKFNTILQFYILKNT